MLARAPFTSWVGRKGHRVDRDHQGLWGALAPSSWPQRLEITFSGPNLCVLSGLGFSSGNSRKSDRCKSVCGSAKQGEDTEGLLKQGTKEIRASQDL